MVLQHHCHTLYVDHCCCIIFIQRVFWQDSYEGTTWEGTERSTLFGMSDSEELSRRSEMHSHSTVLGDPSISSRTADTSVHDASASPSKEKVVRTSGYRTDERQSRPRRSSSLQFIDPPANAAPSPRAAGLSRPPQRQRSSREEKHQSAPSDSDHSLMDPSLFTTGASFGDVCQEKEITVLPDAKKRQEETNLSLPTRSLQ